MLFNSFEFIIFLPIVFFLYWFACPNRKWQNLLVVLASYIFYGWWDWRFLMLIAFTTLCSYASGLLLEHYEGRRGVQKTISATNIVINLLILGVFKYYNFFAQSLSDLFHVFGYELDWVTLKVILPVGISFYTFQALSYTIDVYRRSIKATRDLTEFFAYISFFPQLVAGPIERATNLLPQFQRMRTFDYSKAVDGCRQMLWGFVKKLIIADTCAVAVNESWNSYGELAGWQILLMGVLFTFQIYCDFSGYSDIAIGTARLFGINLMRNFNFPYFSRSIPEFWRRWHISLTTWFTDYIYIPLGGSRCAKWKIIRNVLVVWSISGLWHGANWTFVSWGFFHGIILVIYILLGIKTKHEFEVAHGHWLPSLKEAGQLLLTFFLAVIGWILFRAETMTQAAEMIGRIFTHPFETGNASLDLAPLWGCGILIVAEWLQRDKQHGLQITPNGLLSRYAVIRYIIYLALLILMVRFTGSIQTFIYFQF
jgi:D-alanyl-lipoteichoic acid acyltransferase DltB (MBOAT superfamily)